MKNKTTDYLPAVMQSSITYGGEQHQLSASQYVTYQTEYNSLYWKYVGDALSSKNGLSSEAVISAAMAQAKEEATNRALSRMNIKTKSVKVMSEAKKEGITDVEYIISYVKPILYAWK